MNKEIRLPDEIYEFIKGEVIHLFAKLGIKGVPISGYEIAMAMGITMVPYSSLRGEKLLWALEKENDGFFLEENGNEFIYYNDVCRSFERINMTILHEIGHCVLDHRGIDPDVEEAEANFFAKYAIAPPVLVERVGANGPGDICKYFFISLQAACYAWNYYRLSKRFHYAYGGYTEYEMELLNLQDPA